MEKLFSELQQRRKFMPHLFKGFFVVFISSNLKKKKKMVVVTPNSSTSSSSSARSRRDLSLNPSIQKRDKS